VSCSHAGGPAIGVLHSAPASLSGRHETSPSPSSPAQSARLCAPWPAAPPPPWQGPPPAAPSSRPCGSHSGRYGRSRSGTPSACRRSREALWCDGPRGACVAGRGRRVISAGSGRSGACQWPSKSRGQGPDAPPVSDPASVLSHPAARGQCIVFGHRTHVLNRRWPLPAVDARIQPRTQSACTPTPALLCVLFASACVHSSGGQEVRERAGRTRRRERSTV
jgi:hypothetical protein